MDRVVVLAAGASSRFWPLGSVCHKSFYKVGNNKTIIEETVKGLLKQAKEVDVVVSPKDMERAKVLFGKESKVKIYVQEEPLGAGQGLLKVLGKDFSGKFGLVAGDKINAGRIFDKLKEENEAIALRKTTNPKHFGIVELDSKSMITSVVEKPTGAKSASEIKITSVYLLSPSILPLIEKYQKEHYSLELALNEYVSKTPVKGVFVDEIPDSRLKFPWDLLSINKQLQKRNLTPKIHDLAKVSKTAVISGDVYIDKNAVIGDFVKIVGPVYIGEGSTVGDFSLVRDNCFIDANVVIGAHSEVKNSIIYGGSKIHRAYVGDSIIDFESRVGAGVVFANKRYDRNEVRSVIKDEKVSTGLKAFGAILGSRANIGTNASLMPGVKIGNNATVWPGKVQLEDVADNETSK